MPRPSQVDKILEAALYCFAHKGFAATRIKDIAARAETSEGALYRHYPSKEAVANALFAYHLQDFSARLLQVAHSTQSIKDKLREVVRLCLVIYREKPEAFKFVLLNMPSFMPQLPADTIYPLDIIEQIIRAGQQEQVVRPGQPNLLAAIFLGCILRPIIVSHLADPGALDLYQDEQHDLTLVAAALSAVSQHPSSGANDG